MTRRTRIIIAALVGLAAVITPIAVSLRIAWSQGFADERRQGVGYAAEVVRRAEATGAQFASAIKRLNGDNLAACSPQEVDLMRQIDLESTYIQMVGRIRGDELICTSLGNSTPIIVGKPTLVTNHGLTEYTEFRFSAAQRERLLLLSMNGVVAAVDPRLMIDIPTEDKSVFLAMLVPSTPGHERLIESTATSRSDWFRPAAPGSSQTFVRDGKVISEVRSKYVDIAAVSAIPEEFVYRQMGRFAKKFVPIGLFCGICLGLAAMYVARTQTSIPALLRSAARNDDFFVQYQPVIDIATRRCVGAEALVRWSREDIVMSPGSFIPLAEESGVVTLITQSVLRQITRDLPRFLELDPTFRVAINLTATDLRSEKTLPALNAVVKHSGALPDNLVIEATEHSLVDDPGTRAVISRLRSLGYHVALDDFGTGYSSLSCIQKLALDTLKIDKAFVESIGSDAATSHVISLIIEMAHTMSLDIVAEGVETPEQCSFLAARGVQHAQGWLFGKPGSVEEICERLKPSDLSALPEIPADVLHAVHPC